MVALAKDRNTPRRAGAQYTDPVGAGVTVYGGSIAVLNATGFVVPGFTATGLIARGVAQDMVDNSAGADGDKTLNTEKGIWRFENDGSVARVDIGGTAYIVDDQTVADNDGTGTRSALGTIVDVDADGVWVDIA